MSDGLHLTSDDLLSKYGFSDGDMPEWLMDRLDDMGSRKVDEVDWHDVLPDLVREYLLPLIPADVEVYEIGTIHNPIRARRVNGVEIDDRADYAEGSVIPHVTVTVPADEVIRRVITRTDHESDTSTSA